MKLSDEETMRQLHAILIKTSAKMLRILSNASIDPEFRKHFERSTVMDVADLWSEFNSMGSDLAHVIQMNDKLKAIHEESAMSTRLKRDGIVLQRDRILRRMMSIMSGYHDDEARRN